jgi:hypothetical protein
MPAKTTEPAGEAMFTLRRGQRTFWMSPHRVQYLIARRRYGKSRVMGGKGIQRMIRIANHSVFYINASLRQGAENIRAQAKVWHEVMSLARKIADKAGMMLATTADDVTDPLRADGRKRKLLNIDDVAQKMYDALFNVEKTGGLNIKRLESRIYHQRGTYSRSLVVPANPDTAVGYGGDTFKDEVTRWENAREVEEALEPVIAESPHLISWGVGTPPIDDQHPTHAFFNPGDRKFPVNPDGNWYESNAEDPEAERYPILRIDAYDAEQEVPMFSKKDGRVISVDAARRLAADRRGFDRNYLLKFLAGGNAAIAGHLLDNAMARGAGCRAIDFGALSDGDNDIDEGEEEAA